MASVHDKAKKLIADEYYGDDAAIGDGTFLNMLIELFTNLIGGCIGGARRAHRLVNGGPLAQRIARNQIMYAAYGMARDKEEAEKIVDVGMAVGQQATAEEFVKFVS